MNGKMSLMLLALLLIASPIFAQEGAAREGIITAAFSMAIASVGCAIAQSRAAAAAAEGIARNPGAAAAIRFVLILSLVLIESLALYTLVIIFAK